MSPGQPVACAGPAIVHACEVLATSARTLARGALAPLLALALATPLAATAGTEAAPVATACATCSDYSTQADAQRAADTRDPDHDGIYCESLPCPCLRPGGGGNPAPTPTNPRRTCARPNRVQVLVFSRARYPNIRRHALRAIAHGWPRVMVLNRPSASARRDRLLEGIPTRRGYDRDEYPAAVGRGRPNGRSRALVRGNSPAGWKADVAYVPSKENRSHGYMATKVMNSLQITSPAC